jgi:hypothetical protein
LEGSVTSEGTVPSPTGTLCALLFGGDDGANWSVWKNESADGVSLDVGLSTSAMGGSFDAYFFPLPGNLKVYFDLLTGTGDDPGTVPVSYLEVRRTTDWEVWSLPPECLTNPFVVKFGVPDTVDQACDPLILDIEPALELSMRLDPSGQIIEAAYSSLSANIGGLFPTPRPSSEWVVPHAGIPVGDVTKLYLGLTVVRTDVPEPEFAGVGALAALAALVHGRLVRRRH